MNTGQAPYILITPAAETPISVAEFKAWAKITSSADDAIIADLIAAVTLSAEQYTKRDFVTKTYDTYRDVFGDEWESPARNNLYSIDAPIWLRKSPLQVVTEVEYLSGGSNVAYNISNLRTVKKPAYSYIKPNNGLSWPNVDDEPQAVRVRFTAGYGAAADVPADLKQALLNHVLSVYQNRGDCDNGCDCSCQFAPAYSLSVYRQYRIVDFRAY